MLSNPASRWRRLAYEVSFQVRSRMGSNEPVLRDVQGVDLWLPRAHRLPDYAALYPSYGQNLIQVARALLQKGRELQVIDVGANVGDSAAQILHQMPCRILCVEGDPFWMTFLEKNTSASGLVELEHALVTTRDHAYEVVPIRHAGTTKFVPDQTATAICESLTPRAILDRHPSFNDVRLIKSDTDGYDPQLIPELAESCSQTCPALFFEYDPTLALDVGDAQPERVWDRLLDLGYARVFVWDNFGAQLGWVEIADCCTRSNETLGLTRKHRTYDYWDVAVIHSTDESAMNQLMRLMPQTFVS